MKEILSHAELLIKKLETTETTMNQFIDLSVVAHTDRKEEQRKAEQGILTCLPDHYWKDEFKGNHLKTQTDLKKSYLEWKEQFDLLLQMAPETVLAEIKETHKFIMSWIERDWSGNWSVKPTLDENKTLFKEKTGIFRQVVKSLCSPENPEILFIPDTNALIICPELQHYFQLIDASTFTVVLIPTTLQELDELQWKAPDLEFRKKVSAVIKRIKGFRHQGDLRTGVIIHKTIIVKTIAKEPSFEKTLHWLDPTIKDDRIMASILEIQREYLTSKVILVTNDIHLQNKADAANIPALEPPKVRNVDRKKTLQKDVV